MDLSLWRSALFPLVLAWVAPLQASDGPELPLPVQIDESPVQESIPIAGSAAMKGPVKGKSSAPDTPRVCSQVLASGMPAHATSRLLEFPDGSLLAIFRQGQGMPDADPRALVCGQDGKWSAPQNIGREGWRLPGKATPHFSVSQAAPRATVGWYTEADGEPRILVSQTPDAGQRWTSAMRTDIGRPEGRLSQVTLSDGSILLCWLELPGDDASLPGGLYLRRYAPNGASAMPALLAIVSAAQLAVGPELSLLSDSGDGSGVLGLKFTEDGKERFLRITLPDHAVLEDIDHSCRCGPAQEPGQALRARILSVDTKASTVLLEHRAVPGLLRPGKLVATVSPASLSSLKAGDELLGRLQRQGDSWLLLGPRLLGGRP